MKQIPKLAQGGIVEGSLPMGGESGCEIVINITSPAFSAEDIIKRINDGINPKSGAAALRMSR